MIKVFFSYSHNDETDRNELEKHLAVLKRQSIINTWYDRRILAGEDFNSEIDKNLIESNLILLLVSPDFLDSDYCYSKEMEKALEMKAKGIAWVVPIILEHCDWLNTPISNLLACPKDGVPISEYPNPNKAFNEIVQEIRRLINEELEKYNSISVAEPEMTSNTPKPQSAPIVIDKVRSSNLRIKKEFTDIEKDKFKKETFDYILKYFKNSLEELKQRNSDIDYMFNKEANKFYATIYRSGHEINSCVIVNRIGSDSWGGITYSHDKNENGINNSLNVTDDKYSLYLTPMMNIFGTEDRLSKKGAAEHYWEIFIEQLQ